MPRFLRHSLALVALILSACSKTEPKDPLLIEAEKGNPHAQLSLAEKALESNDFGTARKWLEAANVNGSQKASLKLASLQLAGTWNDLTPQAALSSLESLAQSGNGEAAALLANFYEHAPAPDFDSEKSLAYYTQAASLGHPYSKYKVALATWLEKGDSLTDEERRVMGRDAYDIGKLKDPRALDLYARLLDAAEKTAEADKAFFEASQAGEPYSMYRTGVAYHRHKRHPVYGPQGFELLQKAEQSGIEQAVFPLSLAYFQGNGVTADKETGLRLSHIAAWLLEEKAYTYYLSKNIQDEAPWNLDTSVEMAALAKFAEIKDRTLLQFLRVKQPADGLFFQKLVDARIKLRQQEIERYRESRRTQKHTTLKLLDTLASHDPLVDFPDLRERMQEAILTQSASLSYEISDELKDQGKPVAFLWLKDAASRGSVEACLTLYHMHVDNPESEFVTAEDALYYLEKATVLEHPDAPLLLAKEHLTGTRLPQNIDLAASHTLQAHSLGNQEALPLLKTLIVDHGWEDLSQPAALQIAEELAAAGNARYQYLLASRTILDYLIRRINETDTQVTPKNSFRIGYTTYRYRSSKEGKSRPYVPEANITKLAEHQLISDYQYFAYDIENDPGPDSETQSAIDLVWQLGEDGYAPAAETTFKWSLRGYFTEPDGDRAAELFRKAPPEAQTPENTVELAFAYLNGNAVDFNIIRASHLLRNAASDGHPKAKEYFSDLDQFDNNDTPDGYTIYDLAYKASAERDPELIMRFANALSNTTLFTDEYRQNEYEKWLAEAAKLENPEAIMKIGEKYMEGDGVEKNPRRGLRYLERSADLGYAEAQYLYGFFLSSGTEIERDLAKGMDYLEKAEKQNHDHATLLLKNLRNNTNIADISKAEEKDLIVQIAGSILGHDNFPALPFMGQGQRFFPVVSVDRTHPILRSDLGMEKEKAKSEAAFFAQDTYHSSRINIEEIILKSPIVFTGDAMIFTGQEPGVALTFASEHDIYDAYMLVLTRDKHRTANFYWKAIGNLQEGKTKKLTVSIKEAFVGANELAIYFYSDAKEIPSNVRIQPQHFLDRGLDSFSDKRIQFLKDNAGKTSEASLSKDFDRFYSEVMYLPETPIAKLEINELGYVSAATLPADLRDDATQQLRRILPFLTFFPKLIDGKPVPSSLSINLE